MTSQFQYSALLKFGVPEVQTQWVGVQTISGKLWSAPLSLILLIAGGAGRQVIRKVGRRDSSWPRL